MSMLNTPPSFPGDSTYPTKPIIRTSRLIIRPLRHSDAEEVVRHCDNRKISINMRDAFPWPYTLEASHAWIQTCLSQKPMYDFCIASAETGLAIGGIGVKPATDISRLTMEIGYWLGEECWGKGMATEALTAFTTWIFKERPELQRLWAGVFEGNQASTKVLTKAGYVYEGTQRKSVIKEEQIMDAHIYAMLRDDWEKLVEEDAAKST